MHAPYVKSLNATSEHFLRTSTYGLEGLCATALRLYVLADAGALGIRLSLRLRESMIEEAKI